MTSDAVDFSLVIACYKDGPHLMRNVLALHEYFSGLKYTVEYVFVEDHSPDDTAVEIKRCEAWLRANGAHVKALFNERNLGRGGAVSKGIRASEGTVVGFIDIDLEHLMDGLLPMIQRVRTGKADVVVGRRAIGNPLGKPVRFVASFIYRWLVHSFIPLPVADTECGLKVFSREKILPILDLVEDSHWFWDTEITHRSWAEGLKVDEHWVVFVEDRTKASTVRLWHDTWAYLRAIRDYRRRIGVKR